MAPIERTFTSGQDRCAAWHLPAGGDDLRGPAGRPCVVMAHGFGGTRDSALLPFAEGFAAAGLDVLLFDFRGFGASSGMPRQRVSYRRQRDDFRAAVTAARALDGIDPDRIVLWGTSYSGGHVLAVAADDPRIAAVVSLTPASDGLAVLRSMLRHDGPVRLTRLVAAGLRDLAHSARGRPPVLVPTVGPEGSDAVIANDVGAVEYPAIAGPTWRNEVCARSALGVALNRPITRMREIRCPVLIQVGDRDTVAPPAAAEATARRGGPGVEVRHYAADHFDVYVGEGLAQVLGDQVRFLRRHLAASRVAGSAAPATAA